MEVLLPCTLTDQFRPNRAAEKKTAMIKRKEEVRNGGSKGGKRGGREGEGIKRKKEYIRKGTNVGFTNKTNGKYL